MKYRYANQRHVTELNNWCLKIIHNVQKKLRSYFTFDIRLVGSGEKRLVTVDENNVFDLDYNLVVKKDKRGLLENPRAVKELLISSFKTELAAKTSESINVNNSTSVIKNVLSYNGKKFSFDVAVIKIFNNCVFRLTKDKNNQNYIWNILRDSSECANRFKAIKINGDFVRFKERYLELKNIHAARNDGFESYSIFLETVNEF